MGKKKKNTTNIVDENATTLLSEEDNENATTLLSEDEDENATTLLSEEDDENVTTLLSEEDDENATTLLAEEDDENATILLSEEDDENATTLLSEVIDIKDKNVEIVNIISQERTKIEKIPFVLGSNKKETDYFIDNATVSKKHAIIYFENDIFYIVDNKSTNGTLVEGMAIEPNKKTELCNGNLIQLSNELIQINIH